MPGDPDCLAGVTVDNTNNPCLCVTDVASLQRPRPRNDSEAIGEMHELEQVPVDGRRKDGFHDCLPTSDDGKVHRRLDLISADRLKLLLLVADHRAERLNITRRNSDFRTNEGIAYVELWEFLLITEPQSPIELLDALVATFRNLVYGGIWL